MIFAHSDLALARAEREQYVVLESLCFHAQQAAEKSIKAVLVSKGIDFPRTHSIEALIDLLPPEMPRAPDLVAAASLSDYAALFRYPGFDEVVTEEDYDEAVRLAECVVKWAEEILGL